MQPIHGRKRKPFLYRGEAAMYLIGNFITPNFPAELDGKLAFMQFPIIDSCGWCIRRCANGHIAYSY